MNELKSKIPVEVDNENELSSQAEHPELSMDLDSEASELVEVEQLQAMDRIRSEWATSQEILDLFSKKEEISITPSESEAELESGADDVDGSEFLIPEDIPTEDLKEMVIAQKNLIEGVIKKQQDVVDLIKVNLNHFEIESVDNLSDLKTIVIDTINLQNEYDKLNQELINLYNQLKIINNAYKEHRHKMGDILQRENDLSDQWWGLGYFFNSKKIKKEKDVFEELEAIQEDIYSVSQLEHSVARQLSGRRPIQEAVEKIIFNTLLEQLEKFNKTSVDIEFGHEEIPPKVVDSLNHDYIKFLEQKILAEYVEDGDRENNIEKIKEVFRALEEFLNSDKSNESFSLFDDILNTSTGSISYSVQRMIGSLARSIKNGEHNYSDYITCLTKESNITNKLNADSFIDEMISKFQDRYDSYSDSYLYDYSELRGLKSESLPAQMREFIINFDIDKWRLVQSNEMVREIYGEFKIEDSEKLIGQEALKSLYDIQAISRGDEERGKQHRITRTLINIGSIEALPMILMSRMSEFHFDGREMSDYMGALSDDDIKKIDSQGIPNLTDLVMLAKEDPNVLGRRDRTEIVDEYLLEIGLWYLKNGSEEERKYILNVLPDVLISKGSRKRLSQTFEGILADFDNPKMLAFLINKLVNRSCNIKRLTKDVLNIEPNLRQDYIQHVKNLLQGGVNESYVDIIARLSFYLDQKQKDEYLEISLEVGKIYGISQPELIIERIFNLSPDDRSEYIIILKALQRTIGSVIIDDADSIFEMPAEDRADYITILNAHEHNRGFTKINDINNIFEMSSEDSSEYVSILQSLHDIIGFSTNRAVDNIFRMSSEDRENYYSILKSLAGEKVINILELADKLQQVSPEKRQDYLEIVKRISQSPSQEIQFFKDQLIARIFENDDPIASFEQIENIFVSNHLPAVGKIFMIFQELYSPDKIEGLLSDSSSPVLNRAQTRRRYDVIYRDLLMVHMRSANSSLRDYLFLLKEGEDLLTRIETGSESLSPREEKKANSVLHKLSTLSGVSLMNKYETPNFASKESLKDRMQTIRDSLKVKDDQTLNERVVEMFLKPIGLTSIDEAINLMQSSTNKAHERGLSLFNSADDGTLKIEAGDLLKGTNHEYLSRILNNGSLAKEYLGVGVGSDATPFDTDLSRVAPEEGDSFDRRVGSSIAQGFGDVIFAIKDRGQFQETHRESPSRYNKNKMELFHTGVMGSQHYGIRTGFPATEIDFIIITDYIEDREENLDKIYFEIAQRGYYIPVTDYTGKVIFTPEMFEEYRQSFIGLSRFNGPEFVYSKGGDSEPAISATMDKMRDSIEGDTEKTEKVFTDIKSMIGDVLSELDITLKDEFSDSIVGAELHDTGSTGRKTNMPGDLDFDLSLKLESRDLDKIETIVSKIKDSLVFSNDKSHGTEGGHYQLRLEGISNIGKKTYNPPIDIDLIFVQRSELVVYASHDAVREKLEGIKENLGPDVYNNVIANIRTAKILLKEAGAYKKFEQGGFGGIGTENWILANNGSIIEAMRSFKQAAYRNGQILSIDEFKTRYKLLDPGVNLKDGSHDNFIQKLKPEAYRSVLDMIDRYLGDDEVKGETN